MCEHHLTVGRRTLLRGLAGGAVGVAGSVLVGAGVAEAAAKTSQNGWPGITSSSDADLNTGFTGGGVAFPGGVRYGNVAVILRYVAQRFNSQVEALHSGWCWGWSYRDVRGSDQLSNHASATAIDCNAPNHPLGAEGTFNANQVAAINSIILDTNGVVRWGGHYSGRKDEMHFEINKAPGDPAIAALANSIRG